MNRPVIGLLHAGAPEENATRLEAFAKGFVVAGFVDRQNVAIEYRWGRGRNDQPQYGKGARSRTAAAAAGNR